mmetsp:Transcript_52268/g.166447  ORF Transcript_52268/g.166447 Transcript_52268/m.166447 type:complete len:212 (-) Transcript_52268:1455-2090(-)
MTSAAAGFFLHSSGLPSPAARAPRGSPLAASTGMTCRRGPSGGPTPPRRRTESGCPPPPLCGAGASRGRLPTPWGAARARGSGAGARSSGAAGPPGTGARGRPASCAPLPRRRSRRSSPPTRTTARPLSLMAPAPTGGSSQSFARGPLGTWGARRRLARRSPSPGRSRAGRASRRGPRLWAWGATTRPSRTCRRAPLGGPPTSPWGARWTR